MVRRFETSSFKFAEATSGFKKAVVKLFKKRGDLRAEHPILAASSLPSRRSRSDFL